MKLPLRYIIAIVLLLPLYGATAIGQLSAKELALHCNSYTQSATSMGGQICARYIEGFIDGVVATDARVIHNAENTPDREESFHERVMRTRSPRAHDHVLAVPGTDFCLGDPILLNEIVGVVASDLKTKGDSLVLDARARDLIFGSLRKNYPCSK